MTKKCATVLHEIIMWNSNYMKWNTVVSQVTTVLHKYIYYET